MKKLLLIFTLVLSLGVVGCTSKGSDNSNVKNVPVEDIKNAINNEKTLPIQPVSDLDAKDFYAFEKVADNIKEGFVLQAMINVKLQDVFVVKTDDAEKIKSAIEDYKKNSLRSFGDGYGGEENATAVSNAILKSEGEYVYFIAAPNASDIEAKILEVIK